MKKLKFILVMLVIAVLFSVFTFSLATAVFQNPEYGDYCKNEFIPYKADNNCSFVKVDVALQESCNEQDGIIREVYDDTGCANSYECDTCSNEYNDAEEKYRFIIFLFTTILGIIAIIATLSVKTKEEIAEWLSNGFLLGGLISLFVGTIVYFGDAPRFLRPIIMLIEMGIIIGVAYKKFSSPKKIKKR